MLKGLGVVFLFIFLMLTNSYISFYTPIHDITFNDVYSYAEIAENAPSLPQKQIRFHHGQRFLFPFVTGLLCNVTGISVEVCFKVVTILLCALIIYSFHMIAELFNLSGYTYAICMILLIFNPYSLRPYISTGGWLTDLVFMLGLSMIMLGLIKLQSVTVLLGILLSSIGRQTSLLCILPTVFWINYGKEWRCIGLRQRMYVSFMVAMVPSIVYILTGHIAARFCYKSNNLSHLVGMFYWLNQDFSWFGFFEFVLRGLIAYSIPTAIMIGVYLFRERRIRRRDSFILCVLFVISINLQPILAGPSITEGNLQRLLMISFVPYLMALSILVEDSCFLENTKPWLIGLLCVLIIPGSFHHIYSFIGPRLDLRDLFVICHFLVALLVFVFISIIRFQPNLANRRTPT